MSYKNFMPTVWAEAINRELERKLVFAEDCNREYEGTVSEMGDTVKILGVGKPTITEQTGGEIILEEPEKVADTSVNMIINHVAYFHYLVDDIDKRQAVGGLLDALNEESSEGLAGKIDQKIALLANDRGAPKLAQDTIGITKANILETLDQAIEKLMENDVSAETKIVATIPPWMLTLLRQAYRELDTDNSALLKNGRVGRYNNVIIKMSNNCAKNSDNGHNIMMRTTRAIAYCNPLTHTEPYRPEKRFSDAVKGFTIYGTKIVRPKELIIINAKKGA